MRSDERKGWVIESLVIVASILLAFWIDASWEGVREDRHEAALVASLREEVEVNRPYLQGFLAHGAAQLDRIDRFLRSTPQELQATPPDSVHVVVEAIWLPPTFDPSISATMTFLDAPPQLTPESVVLRQLVGNWLRRLTDAEEEGSDLRANASAVVDMLAAYAITLPPPPSDPVLDWSITGSALQNRTFISTAIEQAGPEMLARLRSDVVFVAALARKMHDHRRYTFEIAGAADALDAILAAPLVSAGR